MGNNPYPRMKTPTFAECFCAKHNIPREKYARVVLSRALYRRTHLVKWLLRVIRPDYFAADFDLIYNVENLSRVRDLALEIDRFNEHLSNHGWLRRAFYLRVSTNRLKAIIRETLPRRSSHTNPGLVEVGSGSAVPFEMRLKRPSGRSSHGGARAA